MELRIINEHRFVSRRTVPVQAADIRSKAGLLLAADQEAAARITTAAAGLSGLAFPESSGGAIQAVDFKQAPPEEPTPEPTPGERHPEYEDRKPNGEWAPGNSGIDGDAEAHRTFDEMEENGIPVIRDKVAVRVVDPENGHTYTRYYDGLRPTGRPGEYIGIEHKVNKSPITSNQQTVDDLVRSGVPATGKLNGEPIIVSDVQVIRVERAPVDAPVVEGGLDEKVIEFAPKGIDNWGTEITPEQMEDAGFPWNVMEKFLEQSRPHDSKDPKDWA